MDIFLEAPLHYFIKREHRLINVEFLQELSLVFKLPVYQALILSVKIMECSVTHKTGRNREQEYPFIIQGIDTILRHQHIFKKSVDIGGSVRLLRLPPV